MLIGKHVLVYQDDLAPALRQETTESDSDKTMILEPSKQREPGKTLKTPAVASPSPEKLGHLTVVMGQTDRKEYELSEEPAIIGSDKTATVKLSGLLAPKKAAVISYRGGTYFVSSMEGGKKITINSEPVQGRKGLQHGDTLMVAGVLFQFSVRDRV